MTTAVTLDQPLLQASDEEFRLFRELIHKETGISLKDTKRTLLASRLARRLRHLGLATLTDYYSYLRRRDPLGEELRCMVNCITTNKTSFFREEYHFRFLHDWLAGLTREPAARRHAPLRIWSAACSSGEEPYSIAITACEALGPAPARDVSILASDIDTEMIERSEAGVYEAGRLEGISDEVKRKYFLRGRGDYEGLVQVKPEVRRLVAFQRINLVEASWPVQPGFDAIFCRNVLIYFDRETQRRLLERQLRLLAPGGFLFVGHSESLCWLTDLVTPVQHTVYRLRTGGRNP